MESKTEGSAKMHSNKAKGKMMDASAEKQPVSSRKFYAGLKILPADAYRKITVTN